MNLLEQNAPLDLRDQNPNELSARDRVLRTAIILFNANGVHTTGIDKIIAESGVAKMTFYKHFPSKSCLIQAYLEFKHQIRFANLRKHTVEKTSDPIKILLGIFDSLEDWFQEPDFTGCPFVKGLSDFGEDKDNEAFAHVNKHIEEWGNFIEAPLRKLFNPSKVKIIKNQFLTLVFGSVIVALASGNSSIARINRKLAENILSFN